VAKRRSETFASSKFSYKRSDDRTRNRQQYVGANPHKSSRCGITWRPSSSGCTRKKRAQHPKKVLEVRGKERILGGDGKKDQE